MGYTIMAFSFVKFNLDQVMDIEGKAKDWAKNHPEIIFTSMAEGMGMDAITVTVHKDYAAYKEFFMKNKRIWGKFMADVHYILVDLTAKSLNLYPSNIWQKNGKMNGLYSIR